MHTCSSDHLLDIHKGEQAFSTCQSGVSHPSAERTNHWCLTRLQVGIKKLQQGNMILAAVQHLHKKSQHRLIMQSSVKGVTKQTLYRSHTTFTNASTLNDGFRKQMCRKRFSVLRDIARLGAWGLYLDNLERLSQPTWTMSHCCGGCGHALTKSICRVCQCQNHTHWLQEWVGDCPEQGH